MTIDRIVIGDPTRGRLRCSGVMAPLRARNTHSDARTF
jgi:hypothetical protein